MTQKALNKAEPVQDRVSLLNVAGENEAAEATEKDKEIREDPRIARYSREKTMAREALHRLREEFKIIRKVWAANPQELAVQLARLGKELVKVVKQYKAAQEALSELLGGQSGGAISMPNMTAGMTVSPGGASAETDDTAENKSEADPALEGEAQAEPEASELVSSTHKYGMEAYKKLQVETVRLDETPFAMELRGDIEFAGRARVMATELREHFEAGRKKAMNLPGHSEEQEKFLNKVGKALKELEADMMKYEGGLKRAMPPAISVTRPVIA